MAELKKAEDAELSILTGFIENHPQGLSSVDSALNYFPKVILATR